MTRTETARDVMQTQVLTVSPHDPVHVVQRLFYEESIHGAPVVADDGRVVGIITSTDVLRAAAEDRELGSAQPSSFGEDPDQGQGAWGMSPEAFKERLQDVIVADHMTEGIVEVAVDTPVTTVASTLKEHQVHRVLVVDDGKLCGIISTFDLIGLLARES